MVYKANCLFNQEYMSYVDNSVNTMNKQTYTRSIVDARNRVHSSEHINHCTFHVIVSS